MLRSRFPAVRTALITGAALAAVCSMAYGQTAPGAPEQFSSTAPCPDAATMKLYRKQQATTARLTGQQRAQHEADLERWYQHQISECRLKRLNQQLQPYGQTLHDVSRFSDKMRLAAESLLRAAGRISKAMTDSMDVTRHNNVGIGVALTGYLGALAKTGEIVKLTAGEYQAAANTVKVAGQQRDLLKLARVAKTQTAITAEEATQIARDVGAKVGLPPRAGTPVARPVAPVRSSALPQPDGYLTGIQKLKVAGPPAVRQGALPNCGVHACHRLANLLGRNVSIFQAFNRIQPRVASKLVKVVENGKKVTKVVMTGGMKPPEIAQSLRSLGVPAKVGTGLTNMMNEIRAGRPVIAGLRTAASKDAPLHAVVVEGLEYRSGVAGLKVYDPGGFAYWQPLSTWQRFYDGVFVHAL